MRDQMLRLITDEKRRTILSRLNDTDGSVSLTELAEREETQNLCHHVHFPKLEECNVIEWDKNNQIVEPGDRFEDVMHLMDAVEGVFETQDPLS